MPDDKSAKNSLLTKTRLRLRHLKNTTLSKLSKFKVNKTVAVRSVFIMMGTILSIVFIVRSPELHDAYIRAKVGSRVYQIKASVSSGGGTGFQVRAPSGTNYVITNAHVCDYVESADDKDNQQTAVVLSDDGEWVRRRIIAISDRTDLCLIEGMPGVDGLSLGSEPEVGDHVIVVGHPHLRPIVLSSGEVIGSDDIEITDYIIRVENNPEVAERFTAKGGSCDLYKNKIVDMPIPKQLGGGDVYACMVVIKSANMTSAVVYPGNSGSPMVSWSGAVVGVIFAGDQDDNYGTAVSLSDLQDFIARY